MYQILFYQLLDDWFYLECKQSFIVCYHLHKILSKRQSSYGKLKKIYKELAFIMLGIMFVYCEQQKTGYTVCFK